MKHRNEMGGIDNHNNQSLPQARNKLPHTQGESPATPFQGFEVAIQASTNWSSPSVSGHHPNISPQPPPHQPPPICEGTMPTSYGMAPDTSAMPSNSPPAVDQCRCKLFFCLYRLKILLLDDTDVAAYRNSPGQFEARTHDGFNTGDTRVGPHRGRPAAWLPPRPVPYPRDFNGSVGVEQHDTGHHSETSNTGGNGTEGSDIEPFSRSQTTTSSEQQAMPTTNVRAILQAFPAHLQPTEEHVELAQTLVNVSF